MVARERERFGCQLTRLGLVSEREVEHRRVRERRHESLRILDAAGMLENEREVVPCPFEVSPGDSHVSPGVPSEPLPVVGRRRALEDEVICGLQRFVPAARH